MSNALDACDVVIFWSSDLRISNEQTEQHSTVAAQAQFEVWLERTGHFKELAALDHSHQHTT